DRRPLARPAPRTRAYPARQLVAPASGRATRRSSPPTTHRTSPAASALGRLGDARTHPLRLSSFRQMSEDERSPFGRFSVRFATRRKQACAETPAANRPRVDSPQSDQARSPAFDPSQWFAAELA